MEALGSTGFSPFLTITRTTCFTSSSGCSAVSLIGPFDAGRDLRELARDVFKEELLFIGCGSSERDDADAVRRLCVNNRYRYALEETERDEALFVVSEPIVLVGDRWAGEDPRRISEIEAVVLKVGRTLLLIPLETHLQSVYTRQRKGNGRAAV